MLGREFFFNFPEAGWLLLLLFPLLYGQFTLHRYRQYQKQAYTSSSLLSRLIIPRSLKLTLAKNLGWLCIWIFICLALMGPIGNIRYPLSSHSSINSTLIPHEIIFLVDTSASMLVPDGPEKETRLQEAKVIIEDVVRQLQGQTISLYAFTSELTPVVPATLDYLFLRLALKDLHVNQGDMGGTRLGPVLKTLNQNILSSSLKNYTVILFSDGGDTKLEKLDGEAKNQEKQAILSSIPYPNSSHLHLFTIGLGQQKAQEIPHVSFNGKPVFSKLEPGILQQLAKRYQGVYYTAQEWPSWDLAREITTQIRNSTLHPTTNVLERQVATIKQEDVLKDLYYQIPLGIALVFYIINLLLPDVRRL